MREFVQQPLLSVGETVWTYGDAVLLGLLVGDWTLFERRVAVGLALEQRGAQAAAAQLREALVAFRRSRRLLAAEDLRRWLAERSLASEELEGCIRRRVLRETVAQGDEVIRPHPPAAARVAAVLRAESFADGTLERCAVQLADRAAAAEVEPPAPAPPDGELLDRLVKAASTGPDRGFGDELEQRAAEVLRVHAAHARLVARAAAGERLRERLRERRLDMTRVLFDEVRLHSREAAREALLCLRVDGMALSQVAVRANVGCLPREAELAELPVHVRAAMASARPGDHVGPLPDDGESWHISVVRQRHAPALEDPRVRRRLVRDVASRELARRTAGRVSWLGHV